MREYQLMRNAISKFDLDLTGRTVLTEAASGSFTWTPILATMANADKVIAVTASSPYGRAETVIEETLRHARLLGVEEKLDIVGDKLPEYIEQADIVTNLGFVRPIDASFVEAMKSDSVICLMWEPWEFRDKDIDLEACRSMGVPILGTNESDDRLQTYKYVAMTVCKLLLERDIEIFDTDILILGKGHFVEPTMALLLSMGARVADNEQGLDNPPDCVVCMEHEENDCLVGEAGLYSLAEKESPPLLVHICGNIDTDHVAECKAPLVPEVPAACGFMSFTTGHVGPKPVIDLHAAGLKVGQAWLDEDGVALRQLAKQLPQYPALIDFNNQR